ncbi:hypothetical protein V3C99_017063 [Haemonchus contortus]|uniref:HTH iclR-type domain-containing protein n=1 Tax=Haemonchus contortus TaxID=6289 RepID=A0A7I4Z844_HAECO
MSSLVITPLLRTGCQNGGVASPMETGIEDMPKSGRPATTSILDALDDEPTSLRDLSKVTQVPRSTIHKVLIESTKVSKKRRVAPHDLTPPQATKRDRGAPTTSDAEA